MACWCSCFAVSKRPRPKKRYWRSRCAVSQRPRSKKRYQRRAKKAKECLEFVKDFHKLVSSPSSLHVLGSELSTKVQKDLEVVRESTCFCPLLSPFFFFFFGLLFSSSF